MVKLILISLLAFGLYAETSPTPTPQSTEDQASKEDAKPAESCGSGATTCGCKN